LRSGGTDRELSVGDAIDQKLLSKNLPNKMEEFLPNTIPGPNDRFTPPTWLMKAIEEVMEFMNPVSSTHPVRFILLD
jgi:hypothetical protein